MWAVRLQSVRPVGPTGLTNHSWADIAGSGRTVGPTIVPCKRPVNIPGLLFGLGLVVSGLGLGLGLIIMASGLGLVEIGLVASNMTLINIYNLVIDVHFCCVLLVAYLKLWCMKTGDSCFEVQRLLGLKSYLVRTLAEILDHLWQFVPM